MPPMSIMWIWLATVPVQFGHNLRFVYVGREQKLPAYIFVCYCEDRLSRKAATTAGSKRSRLPMRIEASLPLAAYRRTVAMQLPIMLATCRTLSSDRIERSSCTVVMPVSYSFLDLGKVSRYVDYLLILSSQLTRGSRKARTAQFTRVNNPEHLSKFRNRLEKVDLNKFFKPKGIIGPRECRGVILDFTPVRAHDSSMPWLRSNGFRALHYSLSDGSGSFDPTLTWLLPSPASPRCSRAAVGS